MYRYQALENFHFLKQASMQDFYDRVHRMNVEQFGETRANQMREQARAGMRDAARESQQKFRQSWSDMAREFNANQRRDEAQEARREQIRQNEARKRREADNEYARRKEEKTRIREDRAEARQSKRDAQRLKMHEEASAQRERDFQRARAERSRARKISDRANRIKHDAEVRKIKSMPAPGTPARLNTAGKIGLGVLGAGALFGGYKYLNRDK